MVKLIAYARVSTDSQRDNTSFDWQRERIESYCKFAGHEVVSFVEEVETASGKRERSRLRAAINAVREGVADGIICAKLDRLARNTRQGLELAADLKQRGKQLVVVDLHLDTTTPIGECVFTVLLAFAELEHGIFSERSVAGKERVRRADGYAAGRPPFGYVTARDAQGKKGIARHPEQHPWLQKIIRWRAAGWSYGRIADALNAAGVQTQTGKSWKLEGVCSLLRHRVLADWSEKRHCGYVQVVQAPPDDGSSREPAETAPPEITQVIPPTESSIRFIAYSRISTDNQRENTSIGNQRDQISHYCAFAGHTVVSFVDEVETASGQRSRSALQAALSSIYAGDADGLICSRLDRFARNTREGLAIAAELRKQGKQLVILNLNLDTSTAVGQFIFVILLAFAQLERDTIIERISSGKERVKLVGGYLHGRAPYGYVSAKDEHGIKRLVRDPNQYPWLVKIHEWRSAGWTCQMIADELNQSNALTKTGRKWISAGVSSLLVHGRLAEWAESITRL